MAPAGIEKIPLDLLHMAAAYSSLAYEGFVAPHVKRYRCWWTSATGFLIRGEKTDILVYPGTNKPWDWVINLTALPWRSKGNWTHSGFVVAHNSIWKTIKKDLHPGRTLLVTGHSQGGAYAERSAQFLEGFKRVHLITFGKPNVYLKGSAPDLSHLATQLSVVSGSDLVTRLPRVMFGPSQTQTKLYFGNDGNDYIDPPQDFIVNDWSPSDMLSDHNMDVLYLERTRQFVSQAKFAGVDYGENGQIRKTDQTQSLH